MVHCDSGGWVVGPRPLPTDPADHDVAGLPHRGCNHIRCSSCKKLVRTVPNVTLRDSRAQLDYDQLYATKDLASAPVFKPSTLYRFYVCCCSHHEEQTEHPLEEKDREWAIAVTTWSCDGHPAISLPHDFDGVSLTTGNLRELVDRAVRGWLPPLAHDADKPRAWWLARLYARLAGTAHADSVAAALAAHMTDPDPKVRARALHFFLHRDVPAGAQHAFELLAGDRTLFAGVRDELAERASTLEDTLWHVAAPLVVTGSARELARRDALAPNKGGRGLYDALATHDGEWVAAHASEIVRAAPARGNDLLEAVKYRLPKPVVETIRAVVADHR